MAGLGSLAALFLSLSIRSIAQDAAEAAPQDKLSVHGYLTQAFAKTNGPQIFGIPGHGTTDYRRAALLVRFMPSTKDSLVIQLAHRKLGLSPTAATDPDVKVDWAFYERELSDAVSVRVGRLPLPMGLQNETRYVGILLPFYRAAYNFYQEGTFTSETIDGLGVSYAKSRSSWRMELSTYAGGFTMTEMTPQTGVARPRAEGAIGGQVWITPPVDGLKVGFGANRFELRGTLLVADRQDVGSAFFPSIEYAGSRVKLRSEFRRSKLRDAHVVADGSYLYGGFSVTSRLGLHGQIDMSRIKITVAPGVIVDLKPYHKDWAFGATFEIRPGVVLKGEYHWARSHLLEAPAEVFGAGIRPVNYGILSMSVAF
jgi:hypothetical protein